MFAQWEPARAGRVAKGFRNGFIYNALRKIYVQDSRSDHPGCLPDA